MKKNIINNIIEEETEENPNFKNTDDADEINIDCLIKKSKPRKNQPITIVDDNDKEAKRKELYKKMFKNKKGIQTKFFNDIIEKIDDDKDKSYENKISHIISDNSKLLKNNSEDVDKSTKKSNFYKNLFKNKKGISENSKTASLFGFPILKSNSIKNVVPDSSNANNEESNELSSKLKMTGFYQKLFKNKKAKESQFFKDIESIATKLCNNEEVIPSNISKLKNSKFYKLLKNKKTNSENTFINNLISDNKDVEVKILNPNETKITGGEERNLNTVQLQMTTTLNKLVIEKENQINALKSQNLTNRNEENTIFLLVNKAKNYHNKRLTRVYNALQNYQRTNSNFQKLYSLYKILQLKLDNINLYYGYQEEKINIRRKSELYYLKFTNEMNDIINESNTEVNLEESFVSNSSRMKVKKSKHNFDNFWATVIKNSNFFTMNNDDMKILKHLKKIFYFNSSNDKCNQLISEKLHIDIYSKTVSRINKKSIVYPLNEAFNNFDIHIDNSNSKYSSNNIESENNLNLKINENDKINSKDNLVELDIEEEFNCEEISIVEVKDKEKDKDKTIPPILKNSFKEIKILEDNGVKLNKATQNISIVRCSDLDKTNSYKSLKNEKLAVKQNEDVFENNSSFSEESKIFDFESETINSESSKSSMSLNNKSKSNIHLGLFSQLFKNISKEDEEYEKLKNNYDEFYEAFSVVFEFEENPYFSNTIIEKTYYYDISLRRFLDFSEVSQIIWKDLDSCPMKYKISENNYIDRNSFFKFFNEKSENNEANFIMNNLIQDSLIHFLNLRNKKNGINYNSIRPDYNITFINKQ